jgi:hypothetical protein
VSAGHIRRFTTRWPRPIAVCPRRKDLAPMNTAILANAGHDTPGPSRLGWGIRTSSIVLDMDSSVSPTHGEQEMSVWNGHYACILALHSFWGRQCFNRVSSTFSHRTRTRPGTTRHGKYIQACPFDTSTEGWRDWRTGYISVLSDWLDRAGDHAPGS